MADQNGRGRFVWHELATPDQAGALSFYTRTLGWKKVPWEHDPRYAMFAAESGPLGGAGAAAGGTAHWTPFISTADIDATVRRAESLGATVNTPVTQIPQAGKYAVLADPQGAAFGVHWADAAPGPQRAPGLGEFSWHELAALDYRAAFDFYTTLFGWDKLAEHDMGPMGIYLIFGRGGTQLGGMFNKGSGGLPGGANWLGYVRVRDVHATIDRVKAAGGRLAVGPMEVPGGDWVAQCFDPAGALFAVHTLAADLVAARPAPPAREKAAQKPAAERTPAKKASAKKKGTKKTAAKKAGAKKAAAKKKGSKKKTAKKRTKKSATKKSSKTKAKTTKKKTTKKRTTKKKTTKKKTARKKATKKKAGTKKKAARSKTAGRNAGKKSAKKAAKKSAKKKSAKKKSARKKAAGSKKTKSAKRKTVGKKSGKKGKRKRAAAKKR